MKVTIKDVAKLASVSSATVSKVLNNKPVKKKTEQRVREVIKKLDYQPNLLAKSFAHRISYHIGVTVSTGALTPVDQFFLIFLQGIMEVATAHSYSVSVVPALGSEREEAKLIKDMFRKTMLDGYILTNPYYSPQTFLEFLKLDLPLVVTGRVPEAIPISTVDANSGEGIYLAASHLIALGHRSIVFLSGPKQYFVCQDRLNGYLAALRDHQIRSDPSLIKEADFTFEGGYQAAKEALAALQFTAICACNDAMAIGALKALQEGGIKVPGQVSVAGYDDLPLSAMVQPALTTVKSPIYQLGKEAARMLFANLADRRQIEKLVLPVELVERDSSGAVKVDF